VTSAPLFPSSNDAVRFGLFCKTFAPDIDRFAILLESVERHAERGLPFVVSMPRSDAALFRDRFGEGRFRVVYDEDLVKDTHRRGWRTQQLVKLWAYRADFADAWLWVDSDSYFLRPFGAADFVRDGKIAAIATHRRHVLDDHEQDILDYLDDAATTPPLTVEQVREASSWGPVQSRLSATMTRWIDAVRSPTTNGTLPRIPRFFGRLAAPLEYLPCAVWTTESLRSLEDHIESRYGWSFKDMINFAPWEAVWVGEWEFFRGAPGRFFIEPPMLHIREDRTILRAREIGLTAERIATRYGGVVLAARHQSIAML
jgi:hypothetical protein